MPTMIGEPLRRTLTITNPHGLHMRPIVSFVEMAVRYQCNVYLSKNGAEKVNGKSPLGLLGLAAEQGSELVLEVDGPDASEALESLAEILLTIPPEE